MKITWSAEQRAKAKQKTECGLFAVGSDTKHGKFTAHGLMEHGLSLNVFLFVHKLYKTKDPVIAFSETWPELVNKFQ